MKYLIILVHSLLEYLPISSSLFLFNTVNSSETYFLHFISGFFTCCYFLPKIKEFFNIPFIRLIILTGFFHLIVFLPFPPLTYFVCLCLLHSYSKYLYNFKKDSKSALILLLGLFLYILCFWHILFLPLFFLVFLIFRLYSDFKNEYKLLSESVSIWWFCIIKIGRYFGRSGHENMKTSSWNIKLSGFFTNFQHISTFFFIQFLYHCESMFLTKTLGLKDLKMILILPFFPLMILTNKEIFSKEERKNNLFLFGILVLYLIKSYIQGPLKCQLKVIDILFVIPTAIIFLYSILKNKNNEDFNFQTIKPFNLAMLNCLSYGVSGNSRLGLFLTYFFLNNVKFKEALKYGFVISGIINLGAFCFSFLQFLINLIYYENDWMHPKYLEHIYEYKRSFSSFVKFFNIENLFDFDLRLLFLLFPIVFIFLYFVQQKARLFILSTAILRLILLGILFFYYLLY